MVKLYFVLTFDLTQDLDLGCFKVKFRNSCISGIVDLIDVKWKGSELIWYHADCYDLALWPHPWLWPWSFKVRVWGSSQEWDGRLTWNEKDASHPFMTMILTSVTIVGWVDIQDDDQGDFRRCAINISSLQLFHLKRKATWQTYWAWNLRLWSLVVSEGNAVSILNCHNRPVGLFVIGPWEILIWFWKCNFQSCFTDWYLQIFLW